MESDKTKFRLKRLHSKKESLFRRLQTLYDMISSLEDIKLQDKFIIGSRVIDRSSFEAIVDEVNDLEGELNPNFLPNYEPLLAYDELYAAVLTAVDKIHATRDDNKSHSMPNQKDVTHNDPPFFKLNSNLPPLEIGKFSGDVKDWPRYRDLFTSLIINHPHLTAVQKLYYLNTTTSGKASDLINNFSLCDDNFEPAWLALEERYESNRVLANHYFDELTKTAEIPKKPSLEFLQYFVTKIDPNVNGLKRMRFDDLADFLLFSLSIRQLDAITRKEFEAKNGSDTMPSYNSLIKFIKNECRLLEITNAMPITSEPSTLKTYKQKPRFPETRLSNRNVVLTTHPQNSTVSPSPSVYKNSKFSPQYHQTCPKCQASHYLFHCPKFLELNNTERRNFVKQHYLCYNCLGNHRINNCRSNRNCPICQGRHHRHLHNSFVINSLVKTASPANIITSSAPPAVPGSSNMPAVHAEDAVLTLATVSSTYKPVKSSVVLGTACALIKNKNGIFTRFRLIIDCGSTATFISKRLVDRLALKISNADQQFCGLSGTPVGSSSGTVECNIKPIHNSHPHLSVQAYVVNEILRDLPSVNFSPGIREYIKGLELADPELHLSRPVDLLLGCDIFSKILSSFSPPTPHSDVGVLNTIFGHVIIGSLPSAPQENSLYSANNLLFIHTLNSDETSDNNLHTLVERFWDVEKLSSPPPVNPDDKICENNFMHTHRRDSNGRYIVRLPFNCDPDTLVFPESKELALQRFYSLESRFRRYPSLKESCVNFMKEYEVLAHMIKSDRPGRYYLPYFCVFKPDSPTTPTRVVFDGSAKRNHYSLNQVLFPGPKLQGDVPDVLLNFRLHKFVFCCDISKMYRNISLDDNDCQFLHIFFRENPSDPLQEYELRTVTYGLSPSSFLAHRTLQQVTRDEGNKYPLAVEALTNETCVDDILTGSDTLQGLLELKRQLCEILATACFTLNKWASNSTEFLSLLKCTEQNNSLVIRDQDDSSIKTLGVGWNPKLDTFYFIIDPLIISDVNCTKRRILSVVARIYDPLGFTSPTIFLFKCLLKDIWLSGVGWDDPIPSTLSNVWKKCIIELPHLSCLQIPRCIFSSYPISCYLLGFADGSNKGSAAVIYLRVCFSDFSIKVFLIKSKTRISASKIQTIPRIELIGALLLTQLIKSVTPFLSKLPICEYKTYLCSDSTIVLSWIRKPPHLLKLFVANRITAILENSDPSQWYHIPTEHNSADCASRGLSPIDLVNKRSWFEGPEWAYLPPEQWPVSRFIPSETDVLPEVKTPVLVTVAPETSDLTSPWFSKYSNFNKIQRIAAYILRFIHNARFPQSRFQGNFSVAELKSAVVMCARYDQAISFKHEIGLILSNKPCPPKIQSLSPFIDETGLIRVGGRLSNSNLPYDLKHPILLSNKSIFTERIICHFHLSYLHSGPRTLQALLHRRFWILNSRQTIRNVIHKCVRCSKFRNNNASPPMGNLPTARVTPNRPFLCCGVDLAGPYYLKESLRRNSRTYKAYFSLFICFSVKAVHIEILTSLSSECFIAALTRFVSRRGLPSHIYCDQGTNFKGAARELSDIVSFLRSSNSNSVLNSFLASQGISFHFNVPRAPFMSGLAESHIKNVKYHLTRSIGSQVLTYEEFSTVASRTEAILNSRPLCTLSSSPDDLECLTPGHFLIGSPLLSVPEDKLEEIPVPRLSRWQLVSQISQSFWRRWEREYLHTLQNKGKWLDSSTNLSVGQLVWLKEDGAPPLSFPLARIEQVHPGQDGVVRAVTLRTATSTYRRPVRKLAPLPIN